MIILLECVEDRMKLQNIYVFEDMSLNMDCKFSFYLISEVGIDPTLICLINVTGRKIFFVVNTTP